MGLGGTCTKEKAIEMLPNGVQHSVLNAFDGRLDDTGIFTVPMGTTSLSATTGTTRPIAASGMNSAVSVSFHSIT